MTKIAVVKRKKTFVKGEANKQRKITSNKYKTGVRIK